MKIEPMKLTFESSQVLVLASGAVASVRQYSARAVMGAGAGDPVLVGLGGTHTHTQAVLGRSYEPLSKALGALLQVCFTAGFPQICATNNHKIIA